MTIAVVAAALSACVSGAEAEVVMEWVTVGDPGNAPDTRYETPGYGAVDYTYKISKYEVTNSQYAEFLNAVATRELYGSYDLDMGGGWNDIGGISRSGSGTTGDPWVYAARPNRGNRPVNYVNWYNALRFANWMHNGQPTGGPGPSTTEDGAYDIDWDIGLVRKPGARVFLPSEDEWYKAAYYKGGGTNAGYWEYATQSDTPPAAELPPGTDMVNGSANYYSDGFVEPTYYTTEVGAYNAKPSDSAYGTFDQDGNVWEWNEVAFDGDLGWPGQRGGSFMDIEGYPGARSDCACRPWIDSPEVGFRVAAIPEPATPALLALGGVAGLGRTKR